MVTVTFQEGETSTPMGPYETVRVEEDKLLATYANGPTIEIAKLRIIHNISGGTERMKPMWHVENQPFSKFVVEETEA